MKKGRASAAAREQKQRIFETTGRLALDDGTILYRRDRSPYIWADYGNLGGKRVRRSTDAEALQQAETVAKRARKALAVGQDPKETGPTVGDLLRTYLERLDQRIQEGEKSLKPQRSVLRQNLLPYWDTVPITKLNRQRFLDWQRYRAEAPKRDAVIRTYQRGGITVTSEHKAKPATPQTLQREKTHFIAVLDWGSSQVDPWVSEEVVNEIRFPQRTKRKGKKATDERRDALSKSQKQALLAEFSRIRERERGRQRNYARRLMACHVEFLLASGLRPGSEINQLRWSDIKRVADDNLADTIVIDQCGDGKTGRRTVTCHPDAVRTVADLKALLEEFGHPTAGDAPLWPHPAGGVVQDFNGSFKTVRRKLKFPTKSAENPLYICRHTYITERLLEGIPSAVIASNCGTSEEMIERHYKHLKAEQIRKVIIGPAVAAAHFAPLSSNRLEVATGAQSIPIQISIAPPIKP